MQTAKFWTREKGYVRCTLCPHLCLISEGNKGACAVRQNIDGELVSLVYGRVIAHHIDPIEKKPLFHFRPGSRIFSLATAGCNFKCDFCQNWDISQISKGKDGRIAGEFISPRKIVDMALSYGCESIAFTYVEPTIFYEYAYDIAVLAKKEGMDTVFVSNGYISKEAVDEIRPYLDAINIDLKSFSDDFYKKVCGARLQPVLDSIRHYRKREIWTEVTTLVIPGKNDSDEELAKMAGFIAGVDRDMPWHLSRFHPDYRMDDTDATPLKTLEKAYRIGKKAGLRFIYIGNVFGNEHENTYCPECGELLIERAGYDVDICGIADGKCRKCGYNIPGRF